MPVLTVQQQQFSIEGILFDKDGTLLEFFCGCGAYGAN